ncbi:MAG: GNAT family N-acetyltransferase [Gammaproteobacteria bacterium]|nr:GNAT family N-acetyltransferase [Gammaproteobacteria bacterium]
MTDMLVKLYALPELAPVLAQQRALNLEIRRALVPERHLVVDWVKQQWGAAWASECDAALVRQPVSCFIAIAGAQLAGFACHDATFKNFFGPFGVDPAQQRRGIGEALLLTTLHDMAAHGYAYAIIGGAGPGEFFTRVAGAIPIADSTPGLYRGLLRPH